MNKVEKKYKEAQIYHINETYFLEIGEWRRTRDIIEKHCYDRCDFSVVMSVLVEEDE